MSMFTHTQGHYLQIDTDRIYYEEAGDPRNPAVLFLHGGMCHLGDFAALANGLAATHRLIAIDSRGHGKSTLGSQPLTYRQLTQDALRVLDYLGIERTSIIGFSDGGIVAYRVALQAPERVDRIVAIGAACKLIDETASILEGVTAAGWDAKFPKTRKDYEDLNPEADFERFVAVSKQMWLDRSADGYPGRDAVKAIRQPVLIVRGDDDHLFSLADAVELRELIQQSQLLNIPAAGHVVHQESEAICSMAIRRFLGVQ
jgi:valacyclovir hydrolase